MKVLIVEDEPLSSKALVALLERSGYEVVATTNGTEALEHLKNAPIPPQMIVADWIMPEMDGVELCKRIRGDYTLPYCYIILLSTRDDDDDVIHGLDAGADDYIIKPFNPAELQSRIRAGSRILRLNSQLEQANQSLQIMASTDALTNLLNRGAIMSVLHDELARARRDETNIAVVMADIDHFKAINDTHGHIAGDHVLREFSVILKSGLRTYDSVGRYGGEEFMLIMPNINEEAAHDVVDRLRMKIQDFSFPADGQNLQLTASFGIASGRPNEFGKADDYIRISDTMLYSAKDDGRNCVRLGHVNAPTETSS